jgi:hypothetical protein
MLNCPYQPPEMAAFLLPLEDKTDQSNDPKLSPGAVIDER